MDYNKLLSEKAKTIKPSGIRKYFDLANGLDDCIVLGVGEPDFKTPWSIRQAGIKSLEKGSTWYTSNAGLVELRTEICKYLKRRFNLDYEPMKETLVTVGGSEAIDACIRAIIDPGDEVLIPEPCYVSYAPITELTGGVCVSLPLKPENNFRLTAKELKAAITPKTKLLILPFPCNPTGAVMHKEHLEEIAEV
ncbi:MAG: aminotransferase class I/II-fold pyridoxal phosphate-dependent enzyme, partial [Oscillospiraceae bacterium]